MTDFRALCAELLEKYDLEWRARERIKTALAQPEPQGPGPTDEELDSFRQKWRDSNPDAESWLTDEQERRFARAVLARWGRPAQLEPQELTDEELPSRIDHVLKLAEIIREVDGNHRLGAGALAEAILSHCGSKWSPAQPEPQGPTDEELYDLADVFNGDPVPAMRRALELWGRPAIEPVPVSERLPEAKDVESKVRYCWWFNREDIAWYYCDAAHCDPKVYTQWLPCWALPQQEAGQ